MHKLITTLATTATIVLAASIVEKAEAATMTQLGSLAPLAKSYTTIEKAGWRRRYYSPVATTGMATLIMATATTNPTRTMATATIDPILIMGMAMVLATAGATRKTVLLAM